MTDHRVMATTIITQVTDDIDGTKNAETVAFSVGADEYTIDLSSRNQAKLQAALKPYIDAGTKVSKRSGRNGAPVRGVRARSSKPDHAAARAWAVEQGMEVSPRGRLPRAIMDAYHAAKN
jgi:hypothetical protein